MNIPLTPVSGKLPESSADGVQPMVEPKPLGVVRPTGYGLLLDRLATPALGANANDSEENRYRRAVAILRAVVILDTPSLNAWLEDKNARLEDLAIKGNEVVIVDHEAPRT
jgi:hypothetical protein